MRRAPYEIVARFGATKRVGVDRSKREAIRRCRAMTLHMGSGASGTVRRDGLGIFYSCHAITEGERVVLRADVS